ncbi:DNase I-like protein [Sporormia fimetaria CBS 119925]|uniref:DNase I-like protein n=1 Tax=Sporormia fimetaria CBS 119925 TaxID=1340428 RepID=A0A6A6V511_9PLEO|nr:DNase I-like protein [Sporormia fimetaria CBS 119925]
MLNLYLLTFNCARNLVDPRALAPSLFDALPHSAPVPDLVAVSLQEISPIAYSFLGGSYLKPYFDRVTTAVQLAASLRSDEQEQLQHVATRSLGMTALMIFAKNEFLSSIEWIQSAGAGVGFWNMGNKGAVAMRLGIASANVPFTLTFAAAHLAPMESNVEARNRDWEQIVRNLVFVKDDTSGYSSVEELPLLTNFSHSPPDSDGLFASSNDIFFLAGDLNYRTSDTPPGPNDFQDFPRLDLSASSTSEHHAYFAKDQLRREMDAKRTLHHLQELPVHFPPTYKYTLDRQRLSEATQDAAWDWASHRFPSWCDRILYLPPSDPTSLEPQEYTALPAQHTSDHRPVALSMRIDTSKLAANIVGSERVAPFPTNPAWKSRRDASRRLELLVGILSYLALTKEGRVTLAAIAGAALATCWLAAWMMR